MRNMDRVISGSLLIIGLSLGSNVLACTPNGWSAKLNIPGNGETGSPLPISRYSRLCAYAVTDTSWVQSNAASDTRYIGRFYVFPDVSGSGTVDIVVAYSDEGGASEDTLFKISYDGTDFIFDADGAGGQSESTPADSGWNLVEFEYDSDSNTFNYWVNETWDFNSLSYAAPTGSFESGSGTVEAVQLGVPNGLDGDTGTITFDEFESHHTTNVGALRRGDADGSDAVNVLDYGAIQTEILGTLQIGQPDCNEDGSINVLDYSCIQGVILNG